MANSNSNIVTNEATVPIELNEVGKYSGTVRIIQDNFEVTGTNFDADGDTIHLCSLPADARIISIRIGCDDVDSGTDTAFNLGVYTADLATIKDEDAFGSAIAAGQALTRLTEYVDEASAAANIALIGDRLWEYAGDSDNSEGRYAIVATQTQTVAGVSTGTYGFQILYSID